MTKNNYAIGYYLMVAASIVIVFAGIKSASSIIVPFLLSLFIAIIIAPFYGALIRRKVPETLSLIIVILTLITLIFSLGAFIGNSVQDFSNNIPHYEEKFSVYISSFISFFSSLGINLPEQDFKTLFDPDLIFSYAASTLKSMGSFLTNSFVILLTVVFLLLESNQFIEKFSHDSHRNNLQKLSSVIQKIKRYMALKTVISFATGFIIFVVLSFIGLDYAILWGLLAFLLNFIPNIGSIISAVPAVLLSLVQFGPIMSIAIAGLFIVINIVIGSIIEPKVMGRDLGLSTLIVFLSLIFWGWLLGPVGMLLSIPLTIMVKIMLQENKNTQWIAIVLSDR